MLSLEVLHVEIAQKLKNLEISLIFSNFLIDFEFFWHKFEKSAVEDKWSASILTKKSEKFDFFNFSSNKSYFFYVKLNSMWKMLSFEVLHVEIAQKLQILEFSLIFSNFLIDFQFSPIFLWFLEKIFWKGAKWVGIDASFWGNMIFEQKFAPEPR